VDHGHRDVGPPRAQRRPPALDVVLVEQVGDLGPEPARLQHRGRDHALRGPPDQVVDHRTADAEAHDQELPDAQVVHQPELVVGVGVPGPVDLQRAAGLPGVGVAQVALRRSAQMQRKSLRYRSIGSNGEAVCHDASDELSPPPGMSSSGKPEPTSW
jgi:hypothetical protein